MINPRPAFALDKVSRTPTIRTFYPHEGFLDPIAHRASRITRNVMHVNARSRDYRTTIAIR